MLSITLHPLIFLSISDHYTRAKVNNGKPTRILGALFGKQKGRTVDICKSFELLYNEKEESGNVILEIIDKYIKQQFELYKQLFPDYEILGWYSCSNTLDPIISDEHLFKTFQKYNEKPLYLTVNIESKTEIGNLPAKLWEGIMKINNNIAKFEFQPVDFKIGSLEDERIVLSEVTKSKDTSEESSQFCINMDLSLSSLKMLISQLELIQKMIQTDPSLLKDDEFVNRLNKITSRIPIEGVKTYKEDLVKDYGDYVMLNAISEMSVSLEKMQALKGALKSKRSRKHQIPANFMDYQDLDEIDDDF